MDGFQRAMSVRKKRSKAFLESDLAPFNIMLVLCFHHYMHRVSSSAFALHDADKQGMPHQSQNAQLRKQSKNRRLAFKGAQVLNEEQPQTQEPSLLNVFQNAHSVIEVCWKILENEEALEKTAFTVPTAFWPNNLAKTDMMQRIAGDILKTIAALKWRLIQRGKAAPYSLLEMAFNESTDFLETKTTEFSEEKACCLDPHWGQVVQSYVMGQPAEEQAPCLQRVVKNFKENSRAVSSREESMHSVQRKRSKAPNSQPAMFKRQAANMVLHSAMANYTARRIGFGLGKQVPGARSQVREARKVVRKQKASHHRPKQYGNAMFSYIAAQRQAGSRQPASELRQEWAYLTEEQKENWRRRLRLQVSMRRFARGHAEGTPGNIQTYDDDDGGQQKSPWNLGDDVYPLRPSHLSTFYKPFQQKESGLAALKKIKEETNDVEVRDAIEHFESGKGRYHSMDAAVKASKARLGATINDDNWSTGTWAQVAACQREPKHCLELHPGICRVADEHILPKVKILCQSFPKKDMVLQLELSGRPARERVMIFVMLVVGALAGSLWGWDVGVL